MDPLSLVNISSPAKNSNDLDDLKTLKYHLLGPSLTKAGQDEVDQNKVSDIIYNASKGSKYFSREKARDEVLTQKIDKIITRKRELEKLDLTHDLRNADRTIGELEVSRDLTQTIVHVDCDAFYAAVEQLERPELKLLPFAVGGGVLTTCNYVARQFGCRSGMAGFVAKKLCPNLIMVKPNFEKYSAKAHEVRDVLVEYDPRFESASIDEAYLNITNYCKEKAMDPSTVVTQMRREIFLRTHITVSAGIAANAKLAKICSNMNKPDGQYILSNDRGSIMEFIHTLPTRKVNGIGRVLERELSEIGIRTCGDIYLQRQYLHRLFGDKTSVFLFQCYLGIGRTRVQPAEEYERKSVGTESTFSELSGMDALKVKLRWTAEELEKDLRRAECKGRTLCLKIKLHTFEVYTRQVVTPKAVCSADDLFAYSVPMLTKLGQEVPDMKLRLMGLRCTHLLSMRRPDAEVFFGLRPRGAGHELDARCTGIKRELAEGDASDARENATSQMTDYLDSGTDRTVTPCSHGQVQNDTRTSDSEQDLATNIEPEEAWWSCPVCRRPQEPDEKIFNSHIDLCLSRQTILEAARVDDHDSNDAVLRAPKKMKVTQEKKRSKGCVKDQRQTKLTFGK